MNTNCYFVLILILSGEVIGNNTSSAENNILGRCANQELTHNYGYSKYFHVEDTGPLNYNFLFTLKFLVKAKSNAHILLSPNAPPDDKDPVYEIVLGAGKNTFSDIRRMQKTSSKTRTNTSDLLSPNHMRAFWVRMTKDGILQVGNWGNDSPFIFWQDTDPLPIKYFSFCTWNGVWGTWQFNCQDDNNTNELEVVTRPLTTLEILRRDLLSQYDPFSRPMLPGNQRTIVYLHLSCHQIKIDEKLAVLSINGIFTLQWTDDKTRWSPTDYDNISTLHIAHHEIWQPEIVLYNAAGHGADILGSASMTVDFDGIVTWRPPTQMKAWCNMDLTNWPNDQQVCEIKLGLWSQELFLELAILENDRTESYIQQTNQEWDLVELMSEATWTKLPWSSLDPDVEPDEGTEMPSSTISLKFTLRRRNNAYHKILSAPLFVICVLSLLSFWMSPLGPSKMALLGLDIILAAMLLLCVGMVMPAPANQLPHIVVNYVLGLLAVLVAIIISTAVIGIARHVHTSPPPHAVCSFLSARTTQVVLFLPEADKCYNPPEENMKDVRGCSTNPDMQRIYWLLLCTAIDHICCFMYTIFWGWILAV